MSDYADPNRLEAGRDVVKGMKNKSKTKDTGKDARMSIRVGAYGRYQIKSGYIAGVFTARAFPKPPTKARGLIAEARGETEDAAIAALHSALDARETQRNEDRRPDPHTGTAVPTSEEYVEALNCVNLTNPQRDMMMALSLAEAEGLTAVRVAVAGGYKSTSSANKALSSAGLMISGYLTSDTDPTTISTSSNGSALIGYRSASAHDKKPGNWIMHPELCAAMRIAT